VYQDLLARVTQTVIPPGVKVVFLADRGFGDSDLMKKLFARYVELALPNPPEGTMGVA
jgi:hypothetical protein